MQRSELFLPSSKEITGSGTDATKLLVRAGLIRTFGTGLWGFTPVGQRVRRKLIRRVRAGMETIGGQAVSLPALQYRQRWAESGRWANFEDEMLTLQNRDGQALCLAPSHEEGIVHLVDGRIRSVDDLPLLLYQIESKYRDDHARNGLVRTKAFTMKDAYSFHADEESLHSQYQAVSSAYERILDDLGVKFAVVEADDGVMGGSVSEEFVAPVENGGDRLIRCVADGCRFGLTDEHPEFDGHEDGGDCPECGGRLLASDGIEVGHVFQLGTRYADPMGLTIDDRDGGTRSVLMGSYGLGIDRLLQTIVQQHADDEGCRWPVTDWGSVAPYRAAIIPVGYDGDVRAVADRLHEECGSEDVLLFDDTTQSVGERFAESALLGVPATIVIGTEYREHGLVDVERQDGTTRQVAPEAVSELVDRLGTGRVADQTSSAQ